MIPKSLKHFKRFIALLLLSAVVSAVICSLHASGEAKMLDYEEAAETLQITVTVTDPWGGYKGWANYVEGNGTVIRWDEIHFSVRNWIYRLFSNEDPVKFYDVSGANDDNAEELEQFKNDAVPVELSLAEYLTDIQVKLTLPVSEVNGEGFPGGDYYWPDLIGISSLACEPDLIEDYGCELTWYDGYDESIFEGTEPICLIPEGKAEKYDNGNGEATVKISIRNPIGYYDENGEWVLDRVEWIEYEYTLKIAGTYTGGDWKSIYCPVPIVDYLGNEIDVYPGVDSLSATLADNSRLDEFLEQASFCLPEASPDAVVTAWKCYADNTYNLIYDRALKVEAENPYDLAEIEAGIEENRRIALIAVASSAVAVFAIGLITICRRKREIVLMRSFGESKVRVFLKLILEQMIAVLLGIAVGGACFLWKPIGTLGVFALVCIVALALAYAIFMSKKLIRTVKED